MKQQSSSVKAFKNLLRNYQEYKQVINGLDEEIDECYRMLGGLKGYDPSKVVVHSPKNLEFEYKTRNKIEELENKKKFYQQIIDYVDEVLKKMDTIPLSSKIDVKSALIDVYIKGMPFRKAEDKYYMSFPAISYLINKAIERALH